MNVVRIAAVSCMLFALSGCAYIEAEAEKPQYIYKSKDYFLGDGEIISEVSEMAETPQEGIKSKRALLWSSEFVQDDMRNLIVELKNNKLCGTGVIYLSEEDRNVLSVFDTFEVYELLKCKKSGKNSKVHFNNNNDLAVLLGFSDSKQLEEVASIVSETEGVVHSGYIDRGRVSYNSENEVCSSGAVISFNITGESCNIVVAGKNLVNTGNVICDEDEYSVFIRGLDKVSRVESDMLLYTEDGNKVYINVDNLIKAMKGRSYCYLNKIDGWKEVYGFVIQTAFITQDFESNSKRVAVMYNALDMENEWSTYISEEKPSISVKYVLKQHGLE